MLVAAKDRTINPDLERWYATRAHSHVVEVAGASHCGLSPHITMFVINCDAVFGS
jgi:hypothetical protein